MTATLEREPPKRRKGRQRRGDYPIEIVLPTLAYQRLVALARETGRSKNALAADLVIRALLG